MASSSSASTSASPGPTTRSRTLLFISYRDSTARSARPSRLSTNPFLSNDDDADADSEHARLIQNDDPSSSHLALDIREDSSARPAWADVSDQVHGLLDSTRSKIAALDKLHSKHVLPGFADRSAEEREIESRTSDITRDFRRCKQLIQSIPDLVKRDRQQRQHAFPPQPPGFLGADSENARAALNVQRALAAKVQETSALFRKKQKVYLDTLQGHAIKNQDLLVASGAVQLKGQEGMSDLDEDLQAATSNQTTLIFDQSLESQDEALLASRDHELTEISRSISTLAELFRDLGTLVIDQGSLLDSIEYNIQSTERDLVDAGKELKTAEGYQKRTGKRKCIFLLCLIIFGLIVVLIFKPKRHRGEPAPPANIGDGQANADSNSGLKEEAMPMPTGPLPIDDLTLDPLGASHIGGGVRFGTHADDRVRLRRLGRVTGQQRRRAR